MPQLNVLSLILWQPLPPQFRFCETVPLEPPMWSLSLVKSFA